MDNCKPKVGSGFKDIYYAEDETWIVKICLHQTYLCKDHFMKTIVNIVFPIFSSAQYPLFNDMSNQSRSFL